MFYGFLENDVDAICMCGTYRLEADRYIIMYHAEETGLVRQAPSLAKFVHKPRNRSDRNFAQSKT